jgi:hypothetical protein
MTAATDVVPGRVPWMLEGSVGTKELDEQKDILEPGRQINPWRIADHQLGTSHRSRAVEDPLFPQYVNIFNQSGDPSGIEIWASVTGLRIVNKSTLDFRYKFDASKSSATLEIYETTKTRARLTSAGEEFVLAPSTPEYVPPSTVPELGKYDYLSINMFFVRYSDIELGFSYRTSESGPWIRRNLMLPIFTSVVANGAKSLTCTIDRINNTGENIDLAITANSRVGASNYVPATFPLAPDAKFIILPGQSSTTVNIPVVTKNPEIWSFSVTLNQLSGLGLKGLRCAKDFGDNHGAHLLSTSLYQIYYLDDVQGRTMVYSTSTGKFLAMIDTPNTTFINYWNLQYSAALFVDTLDIQEDRSFVYRIYDFSTPVKKKGKGAANASWPPMYEYSGTLPRKEDIDSGFRVMPILAFTRFGQLSIAYPVTNTLGAEAYSLIYIVKFPFVILPNRKSFTITPKSKPEILFYQNKNTNPQISGYCLATVAPYNGTPPTVTPAVKSQYISHFVSTIGRPKLTRAFSTNRTDYATRCTDPGYESEYYIELRNYYGEPVKYSLDNLTYMRTIFEGRTDIDSDDYKSLVIELYRRYFPFTFVLGVKVFNPSMASVTDNVSYGPEQLFFEGGFFDLPSDDPVAAINTDSLAMEMLREMTLPSNNAYTASFYQYLSVNSLRDKVKVSIGKTYKKLYVYISSGIVTDIVNASRPAEKYSGSHVVKFGTILAHIGYSLNELVSPRYAILHPIAIFGNSKMSLNLEVNYPDLAHLTSPIYVACTGMNMSGSTTLDIYFKMPSSRTASAMLNNGSGVMVYLDQDTSPLTVVTCTFTDPNKLAISHNDIANAVSIKIVLTNQYIDNQVVFLCKKDVSAESITEITYDQLELEFTDLTVTTGAVLWDSYAKKISSVTSSGSVNAELYWKDYTYPYYNDIVTLNPIPSEKGVFTLSAGPLRYMNTVVATNAPLTVYKDNAEFYPSQQQMTPYYFVYTPKNGIRQFRYFLDPGMIKDADSYNPTTQSYSRAYIKKYDMNENYSIRTMNYSGNFVAICTSQVGSSKIVKMKILRYTDLLAATSATSPPNDTESFPDTYKGIDAILAALGFEHGTACNNPRTPGQFPLFSELEQYGFTIANTPNLQLDQASPIENGIESLAYPYNLYANMAGPMNTYPYVMLNPIKISTESKNGKITISTDRPILEMFSLMLVITTNKIRQEYDFNIRYEGNPIVNGIIDIVPGAPDATIEVPITLTRLIENIVGYSSGASVSIEFILYTHHQPLVLAKNPAIHTIKFSSIPIASSD